MEAESPILEVKNLKKYFPVRKGLLLRKVGEVKAVDDVSFTIQRGKTLGLVGESGCGKSTLGRTLIRLYDATSGEVKFQGKDFNALKGKDLLAQRRKIQMVFQDPFASLNPRHTVGSLIGEPLRIHGVGSSKERVKRVQELMGKVGLNPSYVNRYPHEFSGGQRQRISIARAIALNPDLVIADEAVSALDVSIQAQVLNLLKDLQDELGLTYLFISHDLGVIQNMCDEVAVMYLGRIVERAPAQELFDNPRHPYTQALLSAVPQIGKGKKTQKRVAKGDVPSPLKPPSGCTFHPRCPLAIDVCKTVRPELEQVTRSTAGHIVACHRAEESAVK